MVLINTIVKTIGAFTKNCGMWWFPFLAQNRLTDLTSDPFFPPPHMPHLAHSKDLLLSYYITAPTLHHTITEQMSASMLNLNMIHTWEDVILYFNHYSSCTCRQTDTRLNKMNQELINNEEKSHIPAAFLSNLYRDTDTQLVWTHTCFSSDVCRHTQATHPVCSQPNVQLRFDSVEPYTTNRGSKQLHAVAQPGF